VGHDSRSQLNYTFTKLYNGYIYVCEPGAPNQQWKFFLKGLLLSLYSMEIWIRQAWFYRETTAGPSKNVPAVHQMTRMNLTQFDYKHRDWSNRPS
jgi:hypothetical protein